MQIIVFLGDIDQNALDKILNELNHRRGSHVRTRTTSSRNTATENTYDFMWYLLDSF